MRPLSFNFLGLQSPNLKVLLPGSKVHHIGFFLVDFHHALEHLGVALIALLGRAEIALRKLLDFIHLRHVLRLDLVVALGPAQVVF